jgi:hypothetical protein
LISLMNLKDVSPMEIEVVISLGVEEVVEGCVG